MLRHAVHGASDRNAFNLELHQTGRHANLYGVAHTVSEQTFGNGGRSADFLLAQVGLGIGHNGVFHAHAVGFVLDFHTREDVHLVGIEL